MRKSLFLTLVLSLCVADFGAFAAVSQRGNARGSAASANAANAVNTATQQNAAPVSARAGARQKVVSASATTSSASAPVSARAGARQKVVNVPTTTAKTSSGTSNVAARAATKKAISMGTKVAEATENTVVSQECQNAYYGCMDAFCMLDNAAGGRCQCSDRSAELDAVLDEIMRLDEQSDRIASEGVEQIQMGEYANQVNSKAKSVESGLVSSSSKESSSSASRTLDLSSLMNNNLFDLEDDEGIFTGSTESSIIDDIAGKTGDNLQKAAAKVCVAQVPAQCKSSLSMLQMAYVQKVKSDCVGYENALKQQKSASQQKLLTAQKAVRDAALDEVRKQNRYETTGECAIAFAQCMQTTAECGSDYTGCVTLAATENVKSTKNGSIAAQYTIKGVVAGSDITLAAKTMEQLLAKKEICASVTKQCVNSNKNDAVWNLFLRNAAPALKSAELVAEQNLRSSCLPTVAECFRNACKSQFGEDDESYDICLSNPDTYKSLCKVQLEPCLEATGGTYENPTTSSLWNGLIAMLNSMKVDACTKEIKDCLLSEDRCGKDYSGCIGLDTYSIFELCPVEKLTACTTSESFHVIDNTKTNKPKNELVADQVRAYVARVAQGLALNIDNNFATICQDAAEAALVKACGDGGNDDDETSTCPNLNLNMASLKNKLRLQYQYANNQSRFYDSVDEYVAANSLKSADQMKQLLNLKPVITGQMDIYGIKFADVSNSGDASRRFLAAKGIKDSNSGKDYFGYSKVATTDNTYTPIDELQSEINTQYRLLLEQIETDPKVTYCMTGRQVEGFNGVKFGKTERDDADKKGRFPNLLDSIKRRLASQVLNTVSDRYNSEVEELKDKVDYESIVKRVVDYVNEAELDAANKTACEFNSGIGVGCINGFWGGPCGWHYRHFFTAQYDASGNRCVISRTTYYCDDDETPHDAGSIKAACVVEKEHDPRVLQYP